MVVRNFFLAMPYGISLLIPASAILGIHFRGNFLWLTPILAFALIPFSDFIFGADPYNPTPDEAKERDQNQWFRFFLSLHVPIQLALIFYGLSSINEHWLGSEIYLAALATGISTGGMGITVAHEFVHSKNKIEVKWGELLLSLVFYKHFAQEHVLGHHVRVATREDPATARRGESVYQFVPRAIITSIKSAYEIDREILKRKGASLPFLKNRMVHSALSTVLWILIAYYGFGFWSAAYMVVQASTAILLLEMVNYVEHYGLERKKNEKGHYENIKLAHSWNLNHRISNYFLFNLQRHSDHHLYAARPYQNLKDEPEAPQLPYNYPIMVMISLVPPLWRRVMNSVPHFRGKPSGVDH